MRLLQWSAAAAVALAQTTSPTHLAAQDTLRVLRAAPADSANVSSVVTITFDRPIAGTFDTSRPPARVFRIAPRVEGTVVWRDPVTLRFTPAKPLDPGTRYDVTIASTVRAVDGSKLAAPFTFAFRVRGPRLLARSFDANVNTFAYRDTLPPDAHIKLFYTSPVSAERLRTARLELTGCPAGTTNGFRVVDQHPLGRGDPESFTWTSGYARDSASNALRRVVDLEPLTPVPVDCGGTFVVPTTTDDSSFGREERFTVRTAPVFRLESFKCSDSGVCGETHIVVDFSAPVKRSDLLRYVSVNARAVVPQSSAEVAKTWALEVALAPRSTFTVSVDSSLRDAFGRALEGPRELTVRIDDHVPQLRHALGIITVPRSGAHTMRLKSVNVRSVRIIAYRVPDSARVRAMSMAPGYVDPSVIIRGLKPETTFVALPDRLNADTTTDIPLPPAALAPDHPLVAFKVEVREPLPDAIPANTSAAQHAFVFSWADRYDAWYWPVTLLQLTDLAVTARLTGLTDGSALVTGLGDGKPRADVTVTQLDPWARPVARGVSDKTGVVRLARVAADTSASPRTQVSLTPGRPTFSIIQAESRDDRMLVALGSGRAIGYEPGSPIDASRLGARLDASPLVSGTIFSDRGIYRPNEVVHVKGVVRFGLLGALRAPARGDSARLTVRKAAYSWADDATLVVRDTVMRVSAFGSIVDSVPLRAGLPLGDYAMDLQTIVDGKWRTARTEQFRLAEYRTPEFYVEMISDSAARYIGDTIAVHLQGHYYFGAPMRGAPVKWSAEASEWPGAIKIPGAAGWTVGNTAWYVEGLGEPPPPQILGAATLDANGRAEIRIPTSAWRASFSGTVHVGAAVTDISRQVNGAETTVPINSGRTFILARMRGKDPDWRVGVEASVDIRVVDAKGMPIRDASVRARVVRHYSVPANATTGTEAHWAIDTISVEQLHMSDGVGVFSFTPRLADEYMIAFSTVDARGAPGITSVERTVRGVTASQTPTGYRLALTADRPRLDVGETSRIHFDSPFADGEAWITIEREGILDQWRQRAHRGDNVFEVKAEARHAPNVFASVVLLPNADPMLLPDSATSRLRAGYVELHVSTDRQALAVAVATDRSTYSPRDTVKLRVHVRDADHRGARSEVALWAVDEGVLSLTNFTTPDVLSRVYAPRGVGGQLWSTISTLLTTDPSLVSVFLRQSVMRLMEVSSVAVTANEGIVISTNPLRSKFSSTAFYLGAITTDVRGDAETRAVLPDNLTTFRVMAVAISDGDRYGSGDTTLTVTRPLVARAALPRFVRPGDSLLAGVVVTARDGKPRAATAELSASGLGTPSPPRMSISLTSTASTEARFVIKTPARDVAGDTVSIRLSANDGVNSDGTETRLPVRPDYHPRTHAVLGAVTDSQEIAIVLPRDIDPKRSRMHLRVGTSSLSAMLAASKWLRAYRFDCTEQIASTGRALVAVWEATKRERSDALGGDPLPKLQELVGELSKRQRPDGAFAYWPPFDWSSPWLTAYAGMFLLDARAAGAVVDPAVIARAGDYLRRAADAPIETGGMNRYEQQARRLALGDRVAAVEYLRRAETPDDAAEERLIALAPAMTWEDRLRLAEVIAPRSSTHWAAIALVDAAWKTVTVAGHRVDLPDSSHAPRAFPSRIAPAARLLSASLALRPTHPLLAGLTETVLQQGRAESAFAWNTQDYAAVVIALAGTADVDAGDRTIRARTGTTTFVARRPKSGIDTSIAAPLTGMLETKNGAQVLHLHIDATAGTRPIYYALEVEEVPLAAPVTPDIKGIVVERWYERFEDGTPIVRAKEGDLVRVRLKVTVPADRAFVALEDPLPGGLEPIDVQLRSSAAFNVVASAESERARRAGDADAENSPWVSWLYGGWDDGHWSPWEHKELHDDRVSYFARVLWTGSYTATYVARATTAGSFVAPPAHAEEMYNPALQGRSGGGRFTVDGRP